MKNFFSSHQEAAEAFDDDEEDGGIYIEGCILPPKREAC